MKDLQTHQNPSGRGGGGVFDRNEADAAVEGKRRGTPANLSILANSSLDKEPVPPMSFMVNISMDFSSGDPE